MAHYLITSPHTAEACLQALDEVLAQGPEVLAKYDWGCMAGDHTGYAILEAASDLAALRTIPAVLRNSARVTSLNKFTPEQVTAFHRKGL